METGESRSPEKTEQKRRIAMENAFAVMKTITLPRAVADDADSFRMINNPDGSISIEIRNIQSVETKI